MKLMNKITVALVALVCMGNLGAYTWGFSNNTNKTLVIGLGLQGASFWNYNIIKPGERKEFSWKVGSPYAGWCLSGIQWAEYDPNIKHALTKNGGLDMYQPGVTMLPDDFRWVMAQTEYLKRQKPAQITYIESEVSKRTKGVAAKMLGGIVMPVSAFISNSPCEGRDFTIIEDGKGDVVFVTEKK